MSKSYIFEALNRPIIVALDEEKIARTAEAISRKYPQKSMMFAVLEKTCQL